MALASIPTRPATTISGCARRIELAATTTALVLDDGRRVALAGRPDPVGARRCRQTMNHLVSVRIDGSVTGPIAHLRGIGNRLPVDVAISVAAALALVADGVPAVVRLADEVDA